MSNSRKKDRLRARTSSNQPRKLSKIVPDSQKTKTNPKKAADPYTKEEMCHDMQKCVDELDGIMTDLHDIIVEGRKTNKEIEEIAKLGADGTIRIS